MLFPSAIATQLAGRTVRVDVLVELRFASGPIRVWNGFGRLETNDGFAWEGVAGLGGVSGLSQSIDGVAPPQSLTLSGVDQRFVTKANGERDEYMFRPVICYLQFFDDAWQPLDNPLPITFRQIVGMRVAREQASDGFAYAVTIEAETPFVTRKRPPYAYLNDRDQQLRFPGDRGLERVAGIDNKTVTFPDY